MVFAAAAAYRDVSLGHRWRDETQSPFAAAGQALSAFAGFRFPPEVVLLAVRWYLRYALSYRDLEELLAERGIHVDHVTLFRWVHNSRRT